VNLTRDVVVGTGGIGTGIFLALEGDHTLGREESRAARLLDVRDHCKLHIVCHYLRRLLGPGVPVLPIGRVGQDDAGDRLLREMAGVGLDVSMVRRSPKPTLFSVCFLYPSGEGGNLTTSTSACSDVTPADIDLVRPVLQRHRDRGVALALPEVPLDARVRLLEEATEQGFWRVATILSGEVDAVLARDVVGMADLLAVNVDEAAALVGVPPTRLAAAEVVQALVEKVRGDQPGLSLVVTAGGLGSWSWDGRELAHAPALRVEVAGTAGAGDAHLAGVVAATVAGAALGEANHFASLISGLSVSSADTIHPALDARYVAGAAERLRHPLSAEVQAMLEQSDSART
jgi:sugar/nucleoside kinase (ribokinase family)